MADRLKPMENNQSRSYLIDEIMPLEEKEIEGQPLTQAQSHERMCIAFFRDRLYVGVFSLLMFLHCGRACVPKMEEPKVEAPAPAPTPKPVVVPEKPRNPALQFVGKWGNELMLGNGKTMKEGITIQSWTPNANEGPARELVMDNGRKAVLVLPVKTKATAIVSANSQETNQGRGAGGIYRDPEGGYFLAVGNNPRTGLKLRIHKGDLLLTIFFFKHTIGSLNVWITFKRIK